MLLQDPRHLVTACVQVVVDHLVAVAIHQGQLPAGFVQPPLDGRLALRAAGTQAALQLLQRAGPEKDGDGLGKLLGHGQHAMYVDLQDNPFALLQARGNFAVERAVPVSAAENLETLQELPCCRRRSNSCLAEEVVVDPVPLAGPRRARRGRNRQPQRTGGLASSRASTVVLPEPEGPETTINLPDMADHGQIRIRNSN